MDLTGTTQHHFRVMDKRLVPKFDLTATIVNPTLGLMKATPAALDVELESFEPFWGEHRFKGVDNKIYVVPGGAYFAVHILPRASATA